MTTHEHTHRGHRIVVKVGPLVSKRVSGPRLVREDGKRTVFVDGRDVTREVIRTGMPEIRDVIAAACQYIDDEIRAGNLS